jgi:hypothetical protein
MVPMWTPEDEKNLERRLAFLRATPEELAETWRLSDLGERS